jgi:4-amino-4-deoxy-L-arabinose transferase-like glycosyltransferase
MTDRVVPFPEPPARPRPSSLLADPRLHSIILIGGATLLIFTRLGEASLSSYDDAYYAEKAKEILLTGEWLAPPWNLEPRFDNAPLYLWVTALLFGLLGVGELAARLLAAISGVACVWVTSRLGGRLFGPWVGFLSGAALLTTPYFLKYSRHAMLDTTQTLLVSGSACLLLLGLERERTLGIDLGAGVLMGLAVLNKSLLGYLPAAIYAAVCLAARVPARRALRPGLAAATAVAIVLPAGWFAAATARHGAVFLERHFGYFVWHRALRGDPGEPGGIAAHASILTGLFSNFLPWMPLALWGLWRLWRAGEPRRRAVVPVAWAAAVVGLLSLSVAQKSWYAMPAYPALAVLAGYGLDDLLRRRARAREAFAGGLAALLAAFHLVAVATPLPLGIDRNRDLRAIAGAVRAATPPGRPVTCFGLEPHWRYASPLQFYADRALSLPVHDPAEMERLLRDAEATAILTDVATYRRVLARLDRAPSVLAASGDLILIAPQGSPPPR